MKLDMEQKHKHNSPSSIVHRLLNPNRRGLIPAMERFMPQQKIEVDMICKTPFYEGVYFVIHSKIKVIFLLQQLNFSCY
jgi:hypothetical protein